MNDFKFKGQPKRQRLNGQCTHQLPWRARFNYRIFQIVLSLSVGKIYGANHDNLCCLALPECRKNTSPIISLMLEIVRKFYKHRLTELNRDQQFSKQFQSQRVTANMTQRLKKVVAVASHRKQTLLKSQMLSRHKKTKTNSRVFLSLFFQAGSDSKKSSGSCRRRRQQECFLESFTA